MTATDRRLPHWDLTPFFSHLTSADFVTAFETAVADIHALTALYDTHDVRRQSTPVIDDALVAAVETVIAQTNALADQVRLVGAYLHGIIATESTNTTAQAYASTLRTQTAVLDQLETRLTAWLGSLDAEALIARSAVAHDHAYLVRRAAISGQHQMSEAEEALAATLNPSSGAAWARLHGDISSRLLVPLTLRGQSQQLPMSAVRNLAYDADAATRRLAYAAELSAWQRVETPLAAALNGIKGEVDILADRRGWSDPVAATLHDNAIDEATLAAMQGAVVAALPDFRRYFRAKARLLGSDQLAWWDLFAPIGGAGRRWSYTESATFITTEFGHYSARLADLSRRAFDEDWIDAEPRHGKRGGGFCMGVRPGESRILVNYEETFYGAVVLAHELGHAYHNVCLAGRTALQRELPMTLAETASTFCQLLVEEAALADSQGDEQLAMLENGLQSAGQVAVDIYARYLFERSVFERRRERELSAEELQAAMRDAQLQSYGDGLDETALHPYLWAMKPHFYSTGRSFYNYPYTFGLLFGLGLLATYRADPASFVPAFDDLLSRTGMADATTLAGEFGIDLQAPAFWQASLDVLRARIDRFEQLAPSPRSTY